MSMGWGAARKLRARWSRTWRRILAVELTCAARAIDLRAPLEPGAGTAARKRPAPALTGGLAEVERLVAAGAVVELSAIGGLA